MKKRTLIITSIASTLLLGLVACENNESWNQSAEKASKTLKINSDNVKKDYYVGEGFTSYGLKVYLVETNGKISTETLLKKNQYAVSINDGTKFEEESENTTITIAYLSNPSLTASYDVAVLNAFTLEEVFKNYQSSDNYVLNVISKNLQTHSTVNKKIFFTQNAVYYQNTNNGFAKDLEGNIFSFCIKDDGSIEFGKIENYDSLYVCDGIDPAVWSLRDFDYVPITQITANEDGYFEIKRSENVDAILRMIGYPIVTYMQYKAKVKINNDGTLTFIVVIEPKSDFIVAYAPMTLTIIVSPIGEATIPGIDSYIVTKKTS